MGLSGIFGRDFLRRMCNGIHWGASRPVHELFPGAFRNKSSICESCLFSRGKPPEFTKMGEFHELFVLALSLVWFAGVTPDVSLQNEARW